MDIKFCRNSSGQFKAYTSEEHQVLAAFFELDIQGSIKQCEIYLEELDGYLSDKDEQNRGFTGNMYTISFKPGKINIFIDSHDQVFDLLEMPILEFRDALVDCINYLRNEQRLNFGL